MAAAKPKHSGKQDTTAAVDAFMAELQHPFSREVQALRVLFTGIDPSVAEGIKWNAPSWRKHEYFATTHLRSRQGIGLVLHLGAKARELPAGGLKIDDPAGLLQWLGADRAMIEFRDGPDLAAKSVALQALLRDWIRYV